MEQQEKSARIYWLLLALTAAFLMALFLSARSNRALGQTSDYRVSVQRETEQETAPKRTRINVNTATADELEQLTGIGASLAGRIVAYRSEHGPFQTAEELTNVSGIGEKKLEEFRAEIICGEEAAR